MLSLSQVMSAQTDLEAGDREWLKALVNEWHLLADASFSDLILWVPGRDENTFWAGAQVRPTTGPTALEDDVVGDDISYDAEHLVTSAFLSHETCETSDNALNAGIPVDVAAVPVIRHGRCIAIVERHTNRMGLRAPGALEDAYLEIASILTDMLHRGVFPVSPPSDPSLSPKVGDGLIQVSVLGVIQYASPNAVSAYRRLGHAGDMEGEEIQAITAGVGLGLQSIGQSIAADVDGREVRELDLDNREGSVRLRVVPLTDAHGPCGTLILCRDTTDIRNRERQLVTKDATIREIHHRVKNNLQTVAALLRLQSRRMASEEARAALKNAMARVAAIAVVHELLSQTFDEAVRFDDVADRILKMVGDVSAAQGQVVVVREGSFGLVPADAATSLSLVMTELCQNAVEHGLASSSGTVRVLPHRDGAELVVDVVDDGRGLPHDRDNLGRGSLGLSIVTTLVEDLAGEFDLGNNPDGPGTRARVRIPLGE